MSAQDLIAEEAARRESPFWQLPFSQQELLRRHLALVVERNRSVNLTRITNEDEAVYLHIYDSLLLAGACAAAPAGPLLDIGTGAGYPGLPLAVVTGRRALLIDSVGKKVSAVSDFVDELGLAGQVRAEQARVEEVGARERGRYAVVCARAVAQTNVLVEYAAPLLCRGGRAVLAKARIGDDELRAGDKAAALCGMRRVSRETFELPRGLGHREVISYEKFAKPKVRLPRPVGTAKHHPLGV